MKEECDCGDPDDLTRHETMIIEGVIESATTKAFDIMIPWEDV